MRRPIGLIAIAIYCVLAGLVLVLESFEWAALEDAGLRSQLFGAAFFAFGTFQLIAAAGLISLARWGRTLALVMFAIAIPFAVIVLLTGSAVAPQAIIIQLARIVIAGAIIWYLMSRDVRAAFEGAARPDS